MSLRSTIASLSIDDSGPIPATPPSESDVKNKLLDWFNRFDCYCTACHSSWYGCDATAYCTCPRLNCKAPYYTGNSFETSKSLLYIAGLCEHGHLYDCSSCVETSDDDEDSKSGDDIPQDSLYESEEGVVKRHTIYASRSEAVSDTTGSLGADEPMSPDVSDEDQSGGGFEGKHELDVHVGQMMNALPSQELSSLAAAGVIPYDPFFAEEVEPVKLVRTSDHRHSESLYWDPPDFSRPPE